MLGIQGAELGSDFGIPKLGFYARLFIGGNGVFINPDKVGMSGSGSNVIAIGFKVSHVNELESSGLYAAFVLGSRGGSWVGLNTLGSELGGHVRVGLGCVSIFGRSYWYARHCTTSWDEDCKCHARMRRHCEEQDCKCLHL